MSKTDTAYQCNNQGVFLGITLVQEDPMNPGHFLLPPDATLVAPPAIGEGQQAVFSGGAWTLENAPAPVTPASAPLTLQQAQALQVQQLSSNCALQIVSGFQSSALGAAHTYPSQPNDQSNLIGAATASQSSAVASGWTCNFWCADTAGAWALRAHTAAQIQQVLSDAVAAREALSSKLANLSAQVAAATTVAAVQAVVWS